MNERNVVLSCKYGVLDVEWDDILAQIKRLILSKDGDYCNVEAEYANSEDSGTQPTASNTIKAGNWRCGTTDCICNVKGVCDCHNYTQPPTTAVD